MFDERELRRPEWVEGVWIALGNGQSWSFPRPTLTLYPALRADGSVAFDDARASMDAAYDAKVEAFIEADSNVLSCLLALAVDLLARNYTTGISHYRTLFPYRPGDAANAEMWSEISDLAMGRAPKLTAGGSDSPS